VIQPIHYQVNGRNLNPSGLTKMRGDIMAEKEQNYIESEQEREEGHQDTRQQNFECENPDEHLGCDMGIDVQG